MIKISKIFLWITFIWYIVVSILAITSVISGTLLQIILSYSIAFISVNVANKFKPIEVSIVNKNEDSTLGNMVLVPLELFHILKN